MCLKVCLAIAFFGVGLQAQVAIVNNASFRAEQPVAAGSWVAAFGTFAGVATTVAPSLPLPKTLGGVTISIDGVNAPLFDVREKQLTFILPNGISPGLRTVKVTTPSGTVNGSIRVITAAPGLFKQDAQTPPAGAIINADGFTQNGSTAPARRGDTVSIYGTGPGAFDHAVTDGAVPGSTPLINTKSTPQVFIGGVLAQVEFSGLNPATPGLWQINAVIPQDTFISGRVPVVVYMDGVDSNEVTIFVQ